MLTQYGARRCEVLSWIARSIALTSRGTYRELCGFPDEVEVDPYGVLDGEFEPTRPSRHVYRTNPDRSGHLLGVGQQCTLIPTVLQLNVYVYVRVVESAPPRRK
jgi:hypothetical protein